MVLSTVAANAKSYDWSTWMLGLMRSFLSGGAAALVVLTSSSLLSLTLKQKLLQTAASFVVMGLYRMGEFLQLHGAPDQLQATLDTAAVANQQAGAAIADAKTQVETKPPGA